MQSGSQLSLVVLLLALALFVLPASVAAQEAPRKEESKSSREGDEVAKLKAKVERLEAILENQQRLLVELERRLKTDDVKPQQAALRGETGSLAHDSASVKNEVESRSEAAQPAADPAQNQPSLQTDKPVARQSSGISYKSADGLFDANFIVLGQFDYRGYGSGNHPPNTFAIRRARLGVQGNFLRYYDYKIEGDFADTRATLLRDLWFGVNRFEWLRVRAGHFREPFSQERLLPANAMDFTERSLVFNLAPDRSPGIMFFGSVKKGEFEYQLGAFNGRGLLANNDEGTPETTVRLRFSPWKNGDQFWTKGLSFGGAYTHGRTRNGISVTGITESRSFIYFAPDTVNGKIDRANAEVTWMLGPAAFRAEYDQTNEQREGLGPSNSNLPGVVAKGYMAQFTYLLTGETKPENGLPTPKHNLFGENGTAPGLGAWEVKARYSNLQIADATAKSNRADTFYFGFNWYLNRYIKQVFDIGIERFKDPARTPTPGDKNFLVMLSRLQVTF